MIKADGEAGLVHTCVADICNADVKDGGILQS